MFWPCLERRDGLTALPKQSSTMYFERENTKNRGRPKLTFKTAKATGYRKRTVRVVTEKSEITRAAFTAPAKRYKADRERHTE